MAEHSRFHLWLNTFIAALAIVVAALSSYYAWKSYELKAESLGFTLIPTYDCPLEFRRSGEGGILSLCWNATIANQSDARIAVVAVRAFEVSAKNTGFAADTGVLEDGQVLENGRGEAVSPPLSLGAGEPQQYLMRVPVRVPSTIASLAVSLPKNATLEQLQSLALKSDLDLIGNKVVVTYHDEDNKPYIVFWGPGTRFAQFQIQFHTGRGNTFIAIVGFPSFLDLLTGK
jgi:hypothetical protein